MYPADQSGTPTPMSSLDELLEQGTAIQREAKVFVGHNLGARTFTMHVPLHEFFEISAVANDPSDDPSQIAQRKLDLPHATKLATYILKGLIHAAIYKRMHVEKKPTPADWLMLQD